MFTMFTKVWACWRKLKRIAWQLSTIQTIFGYFSIWGAILVIRLHWRNIPNITRRYMTLWFLRFLVGKRRIKTTNTLNLSYISPMRTIWSSVKIISIPRMELIHINGFAQNIFCLGLIIIIRVLAHDQVSIYCKLLASNY